ncbi:MAG TPA: D-alanine--D-alanine ligase [Thermoanaerobaculia bacterium]|nr:D-alanine--D-alanine ligase [Thermoanaerobaculia bacterium]
MGSLHLALAYDCKEDYLAAGLSPAEVMEFDSEETIGAVERALASLGHAVERVGRGVELARLLAAGRRWDLVFNIAEGIRGRSREAQVPALCEMFDQPYTFSDPLTCAVTLDKPLAKRIVRDHGLPTPPFAVIERLEDLRGVSLSPPLFAKPAAEGSSKGISARSKVASKRELRSTCAELLATHRQPILVESFLPGRELTVGIVGNGAAARVVGVMEVEFVGGNDREAYTALNKGDWEERVSYRLLDGEPLAERARTLALGVYRALACRDAARVDLRCDSRGEPQFLEVNPLPGLNPRSGDLPILARLAGVSHPELLGRIVAAACERSGVAIGPRAERHVLPVVIPSESERSGVETGPRAARHVLPVVIPSESEGPGGRAARKLEVWEASRLPGPSLPLGMTDPKFSRPPD